MEISSSTEVDGRFHSVAVNDVSFFWSVHQEKHKLLMALICLRIVLILSGTLYQS